MKQKELQNQLERIAKKVKKKKIIEKAEEIVKKCGREEEHVHKRYTELRGSFKGEDYLGNRIIIDYHYGWSEFGGKELHVCYDSKIDGASEVFYVSTSPRDISSAAKLESSSGEDLYVENYLPGQWETQLNRIYKNGPKKEKPKVVKPEEREVEKSKLAELATRLPIKI